LKKRLFFIQEALLLKFHHQSFDESSAACHTCPALDYSRILEGCVKQSIFTYALLMDLEKQNYKNKNR
jgi:hypothetical protein